MHTTLNAADTAIDEEYRDGDRWLIARNVKIVQPQELTNGYVPAESIERSADQDNTHGGTGWDVPATLSHPRNLSAHSWYDPARPDGEPVLAASQNVTDELGLGQLENQRADDGEIYADLAVNADKAEEVGGEATDVVDALENEDPLDVSTQYIGAELPPGEYDGDVYDEAEAIVAPDSLALLPNANGQCSTLDGCGVNPVSSPLGIAANSARSELRIETGHSCGEDCDGDCDGGCGDAPEHAASGIQSVAATAIDALRSLRSPGAPAADGVSGIGAVDLDTATETAVNVGTDGGSTDSKPNNDTDPMEDKALADAMNVSLEYVEGLSDNERATLEAAAKEQASDDDSTDAGTDDGTDADGGDDPDDTDDTAGGGNDDAGTDDPTDPADDADTLVVDRDQLGEIVDERVEQRVAANEERREREQRVDRIVANSTEYEEDDREELMETPGGVLDRIERGIDAGGPVPASSSPTVNTGGPGGDDGLGDADIGTGTIDDITANADGGD